jgi:DNA-binding transcriptional LysR family regulator
VVRLTAPPWLAEHCFLPALPEIKKRHPRLEIDLDGSNRLLNIAQREADLALRNVRPTQKSLISRKVGAIGGCVYASRLYLERRGIPRSAKDLASHDVLVYETLGGMPGFEWLREPATGATIAFRANDPAALAGAASAGLGLTAIPCLIGDREPSLTRVATLGFNRCDLFLVTPEHLRHTPRVRAVGEFIVELLERNRAALDG